MSETFMGKKYIWNSEHMWSISFKNGKVIYSKIVIGEGYDLSQNINLSGNELVHLLQISMKLEVSG